MIYDKIKIYVNKRVANILNKDAESFEFFKKDGTTPNKNAFLTALVLNYSNDFRKKQETLYEKIKTSILKKNENRRKFNSRIMLRYCRESQQGTCNRRNGKI